ncbi:acylphosphatase [Pokkaliibacter sp. CJK22405]|uniref:acylphosphatase n=1 Tax=Pokkaliibacter sp. CJK22405 TaxID=3384615 RepID=UPI0039849245
MLAVHAWVDGRVQGVWYRKSLYEQAVTHQLVGWVRNLKDGRVEAWLQGEESSVRHVEMWLYEGPELAVVNEVKLEVEAPDTALDRFEVWPDG